MSFHICGILWKLVVWNHFCSPPYIGNNHPNWLIWMIHGWFMDDSWMIGGWLITDQLIDDEWMIDVGEKDAIFTTHDWEWLIHTTNKHGDDWGMVQVWHGFRWARDIIWCADFMRIFPGIIMEVWCLMISEAWNGGFFMEISCGHSCQILRFFPSWYEHV